MNIANPSSDELSPPSLSSPSVMVTGKSPAAEENAGEKIVFLCVFVLVVHGSMKVDYINFIFSIGTQNFIV